MHLAAPLTTKPLAITKPLVSILIYNYNYGRYLRECLDSALNQSYDNVELLFSDNASTDDSWDIALEYAAKHPGKIFIARNPKNYGQTANHRNCFVNIRGKYYVVLGSDDKLDRNYLTNTVSLLEENQDAGFAITHRAIINEHGEIIEEKPFYNQTCKIPAPLQSAVYMMASVNPSISQVIYRANCGTGIAGVANRFPESIGNRFLGARVQDFNLSCQYAVIYIHEPLLFHRIHGGNDAFAATENLMDVIGSYVLNFDFYEKATSLGLQAVCDNLKPSIEKNARLAVRYAVSALLADKESLAKRYFHLAPALFPEIEQDSTYQDLSAYWANASSKEDILKKFKTESRGTQRTVSYDPPVGSIKLEKG